MKRILFLRKYKVRRGGHITVRDYFLHSMAHPELDPYVYFTPDSDTDNDIWAEIPRERLVTKLDPSEWDVIFLGNRLWNLLPDDLGDTKVINVVLHVRHATNPQYSKFLSRPAYRIANAQPVYDAVAPLANGPIEIIHEAIDFNLFPRDPEKAPGSVLIYGQKNPKLADRLSAALKDEGVDVTSFNEGIPHVEFAAVMARSEVYVALPHRTEGGYRPPLEAMACGCAVVCSDAVGTREYLRPDETCLQPAYGDFQGHMAAIRRLLTDNEVRSGLQAGGYAMAQQFSFDRQRELFHSFVDRHVLS